MDDFNNFFNYNDNNDNNRTPIYHTPNPKTRKSSPTVVICICVAVFMCLVVLGNVIVLATLKDKIAEDYAASLEASAKSTYMDAISSVLEDSDVVSDVTDAASAKALEQLSSSVSELIYDNCFNSVVAMYCTTTDKTYSGVASGFLITDSSAQSPERYIVTNAHVVLYEKPTISYVYQFGQRIQIVDYNATVYDEISCQFDGETATYDLEVVAIGGITLENSQSENLDQADLALCKIVGNQPSNTLHPSLKIAATDYCETGDEVALIGNPRGFGMSMADGIVTNDGLNFESWGAGTFIMTDAAVNNGNSGGPLINRNCVVIGVVESKLVADEIDNMGFAVSSETLVGFLNWALSAANNELGTNITINYMAAAG